METQPKTHILLVEDDEDDFRIVKRTLNNIPGVPFTLQWARDFRSARELIQAGKHDAYLIDYHLGLHTGLELLSLADPAKRLEPFIILTGEGGEQVEQEALRLGAADYLVKSAMDTITLSRSLRYALQRKRLEEQRVQHLIEVNRTKDEFISLASHQLRTPATGVKQYLGMVLEGFVGEVPDMQRYLLEKAYKSNERQLHIVSELLKVARVDAGHVTLQTTQFDIVQLVEDVLKEQRVTFVGRKQTVTFKKPAGTVMIRADKNTLRMVLENLVDNASKYSPDGKPVEVGLVAQPDAVRIWVRDDGVGIAPEDQTQLFQKFLRLDNPLSTLVGGSGLGLYWARRIIDLHSGSITVESELNHGSTFSVTLPVPD